MKSSELVRIAIKAGWKFVCQDGTSHRLYERNGKKVIIPYHGSKEVPKGLCNSILKEIKR
jgi:mRNA interferase HicA